MNIFERISLKYQENWRFPAESNRRIGTIRRRGFNGFKKSDQFLRLSDAVDHGTDFFD
jgi:hypothetical protein